MIVQKTRIVKRFHSTLLRMGLALLLGTAFLPGLYATHIVGGQIGYRWISGNTYEIILDVYRDCSDPANEPFDNTAFVGIYNLAGTWISNVSMPFLGADTLDAIVFNNCLSVPSNVCVARTQYRGTVTLASNPVGGGYRFSYVRCCRNGTITNIINPLETGAVYDITLTNAAMQRRNSTPRFRSWPPIFVCINNPIFYDHSAADTFEVNGVSDSIVYKLCTPLSGGSLTNPRPIPPQNPPPYDTVRWVQPIYNLFNMLGNNGDTSLVLTGCTSSDTIVSDSLKLDPVTGLLTGTPTLQGQFVVGVCAQEYDRATGVLLSTTRRDFQYNVGQCNEVAANFDAPSVQCDNLTVQFTSTSTNADEFIWYFDFPSLTPSSTLANPVHTFPDTGNYTVALIVEPLSACVDTFCNNIYLTTSTLRADFRVDVFDCDNFSVLLLQDFSADSAVQIVQRLWTVTYSGTTLTSTLQNPTFNVPLGVSGTVRLAVTNINACTETFETTFTSGLDNPGGLIVANLSACNGDTVNLNSNTDPGIGFAYLWSPASGLLDPATSVNPRIIANGPIVYTVTITAPGNICQIVKTVTVNSGPIPELDFEAMADCDGLTINFDNTSTGASLFEWNFGDPLNPSAGSTDASPSYTYSEIGTYLVTLKVPATEYCRDSIAREVTVQMKSLSAEFDIEYISCSPDSVTVRFIDRSISTLSNVVAWAWDFGNGQTSTDQNPEITLYQNTDLNITFTVVAADNCSNTMSESVSIRLINPLDFSLLPTTLVRCSGGTVQLPSPLSTDYIYLWSPASGIDNPTSNNPVFSPNQTTLYTLTVGRAGADTCFYNYQLLVTVPPAIELAVSGDGLTCNPEATLTATTAVPVDFSWTNAGGTILSTTNMLTVPVSGISVFNITATDALGCTATEQVQVSGGPVDVSLPSVVAVCLGESLDLAAINNDPNDMLSYVWSPASAFVPGTERSPTPDYIETPGERMITVEISNQFGCSYTASIQTAVIDTAFQLGFTSVLQCNGATAEFTNTSTDAFAYVWDFGDGGTSTETNPLHTYTTAGAYTVTLTIGYAVSCADTFSAVVNIVDPQIIAQFDYDIAECNNGSATLAFFDASINSFNNTDRWAWTFSNGQSSDQQNPVITVSQSGNLTITLTITSANNCSASVTETINIQLVNVSIADTVQVCRGDSIGLNPGGNPAYQYLWSPAVGLSDPTAANPLAFPIQTTTYTVQIQAINGDTCFYVQEVVVFVPEPIGLDIPDDATTCGGPVTLGASTILPANIIWRNSQGSALGGPTITVDPFRIETYTATATDAFGCTESASVTITDNGVDVQVTPSGNVTACEDVAFQITVVNLDNQDILTYDWSPDALIISGDGTATPTVMVGPNGAMIRGVITNQFGCSDTVEVNVTIVPFKIELADTVRMCAGEPTGISPGLNPNYQYVWSPTTDLDLSNPSNPIYTGTTGGVYSVTVTDISSGFLCQTERTVTVIVTPGIGLTATGDTTVCRLGDVVLNASSSVPATFSWSVPGAAPFATGSPVIYNISQAGNFTVQVIATDGFSCRDTAIINITASDFQPGALASPQTICSNTPTPLNPGGNPAYTYVWSPTTGLNLSNPSNPIALLNGPATYSVTVTEPVSGCRVESQISVNVFAPINLQATGDTTVCTLGAFTLTASGSVPAAIRWYVPGNPTPVFAGSPYTVALNAPGVYNYIAIAQDANGCLDTATVRINAVNFQPGALASPQTICSNTPTPLNPGGNPAYTYVWSPTTGLNLSNPSNPIALLNGPATYGVTVTEPVSGCRVESQISVNVFTPINLQATGDTTVCTLGAFTLTASGSVPATIRWYVPGNATPVFTGSPYIVTLNTPGVYNYIAIAQDANGCLDTATVRINAVNFQPGTLGSPQTLCVNTPTPLNPGGNPAYSYVWSPSTGLNLSNPSNPIAVLTGPVTYSVTVTDPVSGCRVQSQIVANVFAPINLTASPDTLLCEIAPVTLTASSAVGATFQWFLNNTSNPAGSGQSITITPAEGNSNYIVIARDANGCTDTTAVNVSTFLINTGIQDSIRVCIDAPTSLNPGGNPAYTYVWSPTTGLNLNPPYNPTVTTNIDRIYNVTISDATLGCSIERQITVRVYPAITLSTAAEVAVCTPGAQATLTATSAIASGFEWAANPLFVPVLGSGSTFTVTPVAGASTYYVRATDANGCTELRPVTVNNFPVSATITPPLVLCVPTTTTSIGVVNLAPAQTLTYAWSPANAVTPSTGNPVVTVNAALAQNFSVLLTNQFGCTQTLNTTVSILNLPGTVSLNINPQEVILGESSQLEVVGCTNCSYLWSPANTLDNNTIRNPRATPEQTTEYTVLVSKDGCSVTLRGTVTVNYLCEEPYIFFPSAFTPNGDGENDVLRVRARPALVLDVNWVIYNRWGQKMYEGKSLNDSWDGTYKGKDLPPDVYGFYLTVSCPGGEQFVKKGNVTLLR